MTSPLVCGAQTGVSAFPLDRISLVSIITTGQIDSYKGSVIMGLDNICTVGPIRVKPYVMNEYVANEGCVQVKLAISACIVDELL